MTNEEFNIENIEINGWLLEYKNTNDPKTKKKLKGLIVMAYMPLVTKVARSLARRSSDPVEDIIQVGSIGLIKAVELYSPVKNTSFKTYATYLITGEIRHYLRDKTSMIRAPREIKELSYRVHKITLELTEKLGVPPSDEQLAEALQMPQQRIAEVIELDRRTTTISIDQSTGCDAEQNSTIAEKIPDENENLNREIFENRMILNDAINSLDEEDKKIVTMSFFDGLNQREISERLNISQMQVSRKMKKVLNKLFDFITSKGVVSYE